MVKNPRRKKLLNNSTIRNGSKIDIRQPSLLEMACHRLIYLDVASRIYGPLYSYTLEHGRNRSADTEEKRGRDGGKAVPSLC